MSLLVLAVGIAAGFLATLVLVFLVIAPPRPRVARDRRFAPGVEHQSALTKAARRTTDAIDAIASNRRTRLFGEEELDLAGIRSTPAQFVVAVASSASVAALVGVLLGLANGTSALLGGLFALLTPLLAKFFLAVRTTKRRTLFANQIDDTVQLLAGSLRAGHGLSIAVASVASESDPPMSAELARAVNESRLGRPLADALQAVSHRMRSKDFDWVAQAVAINTETGGNLASVLDQVGKTIRERGQIRRHIAALSAEGRLSAVILILLPIALFGFFAIIRPEYIGAFFTNPIGVIALIAAGVLMILGAIWIASVVKVRF